MQKVKIMPYFPMYAKKKNPNPAPHDFWSNFTGQQIGIEPRTALLKEIMSN